MQTVALVGSISFIVALNCLPRFFARPDVWPYLTPNVRRVKHIVWYLEGPLLSDRIRRSEQTVVNTPGCKRAMRRSYL